MRPACRLKSGGVENVEEEMIGKPAEACARIPPVGTGHHQKCQMTDKRKYIRFAYHGFTLNNYAVDLLRIMIIHR